MNKTQETPAYNEQLEMLSDQISRIKEELQTVSASKAELEDRLLKADRETADCQSDLEKLQAQESELVETLAQETKNEAELRITHNKQTQELDSKMNQDQQVALDEIDRLTKALENARALSDRYTLEREETLAQKNQAVDNAQQVWNQHAASQKILQDEMDQISQRLKESLNAASIRRSVAHLELENAENAVSLAENALDETAISLEEAENILAQRKQAWEGLAASKDKEMQETQAMCEDLVAEARQQEQQASREFIAKKQELEKAQNMLDLANKALATAEEGNHRLRTELQALYQQAEEESAQINADMEEALRRAVTERNSYSKAVTLANDLEAQSTQAAAEEAKTADLVSRLHIEVQDLWNAVLVARNLVTDATAAKSNSDPDMVDAIVEMERALSASAEETLAAAQAKEKQLAEEEKKLNALTGRARQKKLASDTAQKLLSEAEERCSAAEQTMFELSSQAENRTKSKLGQLIAGKRAAYEQALRETKELKLAASNANNSLRTIKNEASKAERAMTASARNAAQVIAASEKTLAETEQRYETLLLKAKSMLDIAADKREKLVEAQTNRKQSLINYQNQLQLQRDSEEEASADYDDLFASSQEQLAKLKAEIEEAIAKDNVAYNEVKVLADEAEAKHEQVLRDSIGVSDQIINYQEQLAKQKEEYEKLVDTHRTQKQTILSLAERQIQEKAATRQGLERRLSYLTPPLSMAKLNLEQARKTGAQLRAKKEALRLREERCSGQLVRLTQEFQDAQAAEEQRSSQLAEQRRLEAARAADALAKREEEERQRELKEKARLAQELEAAHVAAEGARARKAAEEYHRQAKAKEEALRLAAGQFLSEEDNLRLISSGELSQRIAAMSDLARQEVNRQEVRWLSPEEAADLVNSAEQARQGAVLQEQMFNAAQTTYNSLMNELDDCRDARKTAAQRVAGVIANDSRIRRQKVALDQALSGAQEALACMPPEGKEVFSITLQQLQKMKDDNDKDIQSADTRLAEVQRQLDQADQDVAMTEQAANDAQQLLQEIANKWIYSAYQAVRQEAEVEVMRCEAADRNEIADLAKQRYEAARKAAMEAGEGEERIGSVQKLTNQRRKKKKK